LLHILRNKLKFTFETQLGVTGASNSFKYEQTLAKSITNFSNNDVEFKFIESQFQGVKGAI